jgi:mRNA interferase HicA
MSSLVDSVALKQRELKRRIADAARERGLIWTKLRDGRQHELWQCGSTKLTIPRHRELNEYTAEGILKDLEGELGEGWWRR